MSTLNNSSIIERTNHLMTSELDDEIVMLNVQRGNYYGLSGVARRIWELLENPQSIDQICRSLMGEYEVGESQCFQDVCKFVDQLVAENVVRVVE